VVTAGMCGVHQFQPYRAHNADRSRGLEGLRRKCHLTRWGRGDRAPGLVRCQFQLVSRAPWIFSPPLTVTALQDSFPDAFLR